MDIEEISAKLREKTGMSEEEVEVFFDLAQYSKVGKNSYVERQGDSKVHFVLIKSGCLMTYHTDRDADIHVLQFGREMWWTGDLQAYFTHSPSIYSIKAVMDSEVYMLSQNDFDLLLQKSPSFERYYRILFQNALVSHQKRIMRNISFTAEERYKAFRETFPGLELVVPQKYIASYLGISPEFLSKMKKRLHFSES